MDISLQVFTYLHTYVCIYCLLWLIFMWIWYLEVVRATYVDMVDMYINVCVEETIFNFISWVCLHVANNFKPSCNKLPQGEKWLLQISISRSSLCQWLLWWSICDKPAWSDFELWQRTPRQSKGREVKYDKVCSKVCFSRCREYRSALVPEKWGHDMSGLGLTGKLLTWSLDVIGCHWMSLVRLVVLTLSSFWMLPSALVQVNQALTSMAAMFVVAGGVRWRERRSALRAGPSGPSTAVVGSPQETYQELVDKSEFPGGMAVAEFTPRHTVTYPDYWIDRPGLHWIFEEPRNSQTLNIFSHARKHTNTQ